MSFRKILVANPGEIACRVKRTAHRLGYRSVAVFSDADLPEALAGARREALGAFGDGTLMLERLVEGGCHIEVQVFADAHGHVVHLGELDCMPQRRRQKIIEETPSPAVGPDLRARLCADAIAAARAVGYRGAGTVEFIVEAQGQHHFLEMNTRLQVEHPVTELVSGLDLVEWQLRVAAGEPLPLAQDQITFTGQAIEARLVAEDSHDGWELQTGRIARWQPARASVRVDPGTYEGGQITPHYDAMVARFIAHGTDRAEVWPVHQKTAELGGHLRSGLEDTFHLPGGERAPGNGALIEALAAFAQGAGLGVAPPAEARTRLGLHAGAAP